MLRSTMHEQLLNTSRLKHTLLLQRLNDVLELLSRCQYAVTCTSLGGKDVRSRHGRLYPRQPSSAGLRRWRGRSFLKMPTFLRLSLLFRKRGGVAALVEKFWKVPSSKQNLAKRSDHLGTYGTYPSHITTSHLSSHAFS